MQLRYKQPLLPALLLFILSLLTWRNSFATRTISGDQWHKLTNDRAFNYKDQVEAAQVQTDNSNVIQKLLSGLWAFFSSDFGSFLLWALVICAILFITYRLFLSNDSFLFGRSRQKMTETESEQSDDEDISTTDWELLLQKAINDKDLRLAVRYSYMWLLQMLQHKELIQYRPDKTNYDYYSELRDTEYKQAFKVLSRRYEYTWYGKFVMSPSAYNEFNREFDGIRKQLGA
jgi:hypothetical protein